MTRSAALLLTVVTGFTGLVYEVTWQRYLAVLLGAHSQATAVVLGFFLGGLALGYAGFGALTRRRIASAPRTPHLLLLYGLVEAAIGGWALAFPALFALVGDLSLALPRPAGPLAFALDAACAALLVGPPAVLMGGTIPILTQALSRDLDDATRWHARVYGLNALGATAGALAAGFWMLPALGLIGCLRAMALLNLVAGAGFAWLDRRAPGRGASAAAVRPEQVGREPALAAAALCVGAAMMTVQTLLIRLGALALGASQFTFSMVVAVFVLCIALGSLAVSGARRLPGWVLVANLWSLLVLLALLYVVIDAAPWAAHAVRSLFRDHSLAFFAYHGTVLVLLVAVIGPPVLMSGATLPLLFHALRREGVALGETAGRLYAWNTLGSLVGALIGGYLALAWLDLHEVYRLALVSVALAAGLVSVRVGGVPSLAALALVAAGGVGVAVLGPWSAERLSSGIFRIRQPLIQTAQGPDAFFSAYGDDPLVFYDDDPVMSVSIRERVGADGTRNTSIATNGKGDGSLTYDYPTMGLAAVIPALLAEKAERAFVIGWGTGVSAGELASLDSMREVVVAEISPAVVAGAPHFAHGNLDAASNPRVRIELGDAYRTLLRSSERYDVILSEPSNPWVLGVEMLYSREFLEAARDRLAPGGVHAQWTYLYEMDRRTLDLVLRTYLAVFDEVSLWYGLGVDLLILGRQAPDWEGDIDRIMERAVRPDFAAALARSGVTSVPALLAHELLPTGVLAESGLEGELHTLFHPRLSDRAARAFFAGGRARIPASSRIAAAELGADRSLVTRYAERLGRPLDDEEIGALTGETCVHRSSECLALLAWWGREQPRSRARAQLLDAIGANPLAARDGAVRLDRLGRVAALFEPDPGEANGADPLLMALRTTDLFYIHYHHAAPFSRARLDEVWRRCAASTERREVCDRARPLAESHLGPLAPARDAGPADLLGHAPAPRDERARVPSSEP